MITEESLKVYTRLKNDPEGRGFSDKDWKEIEGKNIDELILRAALAGKNQADAKFMAETKELITKNCDSSKTAELLYKLALNS